MKTRRSRGFGVLGATAWVGAALGTAATFAVTLVGGAFVHLNLPAVRRLVVHEVTGALEPQFKGQIVLHDVGRIDLLDPHAASVSGVRAELLAPDARRSALVDGVGATIDLDALVRSLVTPGAALRIDVRALRVAAADVTLAEDREGVLGLVRAFEPRVPSPPSPEGAGVSVSLGEVALEHVWVHGAVAGSPPLDAELDGVRGWVRVAPLAQGTSVTLAVTRAELTTRGMPSGANPRGAITLQLALPSDTGKPMAVGADFRGDVGGVPAVARARVDGARVDATLDVPRVAGERLRALVPEAPLHDAVALHAEARGELPHLETSVRLQLGQATVTADADVTLGDSVVLSNVAVEARHLDARGFAPSAPATDVSFDLTSRAMTLGPSGPSGPFTLDVRPGRAAGQRVPAARVSGTAAGSVVRARGRVSEPGAPIDFSATLRVPAQAVDFDVRASADDLQRIARVGPLARGSARVHAHGTVFLATSTLRSQVVVEGHGVERDGAALEELRVAGTVSGPLARPVIDATVDAHGIRYEEQSFAAAHVQLRGPVNAPVVSAVVHGGEGQPRIEADTAIAFAGSNVTLKNTRVSVVQPDATVTVRSERIAIGKRGVTVEDATVEGLGEPASAAIEHKGTETFVRFHVEGFDLARAARLARLDPEVVRAGVVSADVELRVSPEGASGTARVDASGMAVAMLQSSSAKLRAEFDGRRIRAEFHAALDDAATFDARTEGVELPGSPLDPGAWRKSFGHVHLEGSAELPRLSRLLFPQAPAHVTHGKASMTLDLGRLDADAQPDLDVTVRTDGLVAEGTLEPWRFAGVDAALSASVMGATGDAKIALDLTDAQGELLSFDASADLPEGELLKNPGRAVELLLPARLDAHVRIPRRKLATFPAAAFAGTFEGDVALDVRASGSLLDPKVRLEAHSWDLRRAQTTFKPATNADVIGVYEGGQGHVNLRVRIPKDEVLTMTVTGHARAADFLRPTEKAPAWGASVHGRVRRFPLDSVTFFSDHATSGQLSGDFSVEDLHENARARVALELRRLRMGLARYRRATLAFDLDDRGARVRARVDQRDGHLELNGDAGFTWGKELLPTFQATQPIHASLQAKNFRAAGLLPFLQPSVSAIDGRVDADAKATLPKRGARPSLEGWVSLREGSIELPAVGERFYDARARLSFAAGGVVRLQGAEARAGQGRVKADAFARFDEGRMIQARAYVEFPKGEALPLAVQGESLGDAQGKIDIHASTTADKKSTHVDVVVPSMQVRLSDVNSRPIQELDEPERVRIGIREEGNLRPIARSPAEAPESAKPEEAHRLEVSILLGNDVNLRRGTELRVALDGNPKLVIEQESSMSGEIRLRSGYLDVQGKRFEIDRGTVTFTGEADNPTANITAVYAPTSDLRIYADFVGPIKTGRLTLRSEPAHSQSEILAMLIYGADYNDRAVADPSNSAAIGVGGGIASQGLNKALQGLTGSDVVSVRIDTSRAMSTRSEVEFQIARDVSIQLARVFGVPPMDLLDRHFVTFDWRFRRNWALETTVGDRGSSIMDLIWQQRY